MIFVIDDNEIMAECIARATGRETKVFYNAIDAMNAMVKGNELPELIFLDILLDGPNGFSFLNELISYDDTSGIPVVLVTSLEIKGDLSDYGVVAMLDKSTMTPKELREYVEKYARH